MNCVYCEYNLLRDSYNVCTYKDGECVNLTRLEKENAELKAQIKMLELGYVWHDYDAGEDCYEDSHEGRWVKRDEIVKLTQAKELLRRFVDAISIAEICIAKSRAEQFLKEVEE